MPNISESDYLTIVDAIQSPDVLDEEKKEFATIMQMYEDQQKSLNLPLLPNNEYNEQEIRKNKFKTLFSGTRSIPLPPIMSEYLEDDESKLQYANEEFIRDWSETPFSSDNYYSYKDNFVSANRLTDTSELGIYNFIQQQIADQEVLDKKYEISQQEAMDAAIKGDDFNIRLSNLQKAQGIDAIDVSKYNATYEFTKDIVDRYSPDRDKFVGAMTRKMTTGASTEDAALLDEFYKKLIDVPEIHRNVIIANLANIAEKQGVDRAKLFNNVANEFADSFGRIFSQGFVGMSSLSLENQLSRVGDKGEIRTKIPQITNIEEAKAYVSEQISLQQSEQIATATIGAPEVISMAGASGVGSSRQVTDTESNLIVQAKNELQKGLNISRKIRSIGISLDPIRDNWKGIMASTVGSSTALLGLAALPGGMAVSTELYTGMNYDKLRSEYPNMTPNDAAVISSVSGAIESLIDKGNISFLKNIPWFKGLIVGAESTTKKLLAGAATGTYIFENVAEGAQDITLPVVQYVLQGIKESIPEVDMEKELAEWWKTRPDVAIGMIPLTLIGLGGNIADKYFDKKTQLKELSNITNLTRHGISESSRVEIVRLAKEGNLGAAKNVLNQALINRDINIVTQLATNEQSSEDAALIIERAKVAGLIPKFDTNRQDNTLVDIFDSTGKNISVTIPRSELSNHIQRTLTEKTTANIDIVNDYIDGKDITGNDEIVTSSSTISEIVGAISQLQGLNPLEVTELQQSLGSDLQREDAFNSIVTNLRTNDTVDNISKEYVGSVYNGLPSDVKTRLGATPEQGKIRLTELIRNKKPSRVPVSKEQLTFVNLSNQEALKDNIVTLEQLQSGINVMNSKTRALPVPTDIKVSRPVTESGKQKTIIGQIIRDIKQIFDTNVVFFSSETEGVDTFQGFYDPNTDTIWINTESKNPLLFILGHEFGHSIQKKSPQLYKQLKDIVEAQVPLEIRQEYYDTLKAATTVYDNEAIANEFVMDFLANRMMDGEFLTQLFESNRSLFRQFVDALKAFVQTLSNKITKTRDVSPYFKGEISKINASVIDIINQFAQVSNRTKAQFDGFTTYLMSSDNKTETRLEYIVNHMRATLAGAAKQAQKKDKAGDAAPSTGVTIDVPISLENSNVFEETVNYYSTIHTDIAKQDLTNADSRKAFRTKAMKFYINLRYALKNQVYSLDSLARALAVTKRKLTADEVNKLNIEEKTTLIADAYKTIDDVIKQSYIANIESFVSRMDERAANGDLNDRQIAIKDALKSAINSVDPAKDATDILSKIYTSNGIPNIGAGDTFFNNMLKLYALKAINRNLDTFDLQQANTFLQDLSEVSKTDKTFADTLADQLNSAKNELTSNPSLITKAEARRKEVQEGKWKWLTEIKRLFNSFMDNHLTFASLLEVAFPNKQSVATQQRIQQLQSKINDNTADDVEKAEFNMLASTVTGQALTPTLQKISDDISLAYNNIINETEANLDNLITLVDKTFGTGKKWKSIDSKQKLYDIMTIDKGFDIVINGETNKISQAFAAYILNIADQSQYTKRLADKGFDSKVINFIRSTVNKDFKGLNEFRKELRVLIRDEILNTRNATRETLGFAAPLVDTNFFPVQFDDKKIAIINPYDIQYASGTIDPNFNPVLDTSEHELDLDVVEQGNNVLSMFNSYMNQSIFKRNIDRPIIAAKNILTDKTISDQIEKSFGKAYKQILFKQLGAFETNGIRSNFLDYITTNRVRKILTNVARGAMGFRLSTMLVNLTSSLNTTMDTSIPAGQVLKSYTKVMAGIIGLGNAKMTRAQAAKHKIIQDRIKIGANSIISMSKTQTFVDKPGYLQEVANVSLRPMSRFDALGGTIAAAAAYDAHYSMAEKAGITDKNKLQELAEEGMARTIQKTFQPNTIAGKASFEMESNPFLKLLTLFMSEQRKTLGLEIATFKKSGLASKEMIRLLLVNHVLLGTTAFVLRAGIKDLLSPEGDDEDIWNINRLVADIAIGPLGATLVAGTIFEEAIFKFNNLLVDAEAVPGKKIQIFGEQNALVQAGSQASSILKLPEALIVNSQDLSNDEIIKLTEKSIKGFSSLTGNTVLGSLSTMTNAASQLIDLIYSDD